MAPDTILRRVEQHRDRWGSFASESGSTQVSERLSAEELKRYEIFRSYDEGLLERISPDVSVAAWAPDTVLFEEGSYIDLAFHVVSGEVAVYLASKQDPDVDAPIFAGAETRGGPAPGGSVSSQTAYYKQTELAAEGAEPTLLSVMDFDLPSASTTVPLGPGEFFGEIGALSGWPQSVTARTTTACELVQIRLPALRLMKRQSSDLKERLDTLYRRRSLLPQLKACPMFRGCDDDLIASLGGSSELISCGPGEVVVEESAALDALYLVRSGFMKLSQQVGQGRAAVSYLSKGLTFGEIELLVDGLDRSRYTVSSVGYGELVRIPGATVREILRAAPDVEERLWERVVHVIKETGASRSVHGSEFVEFALDKGLVEGNSILVIDLEQSTRCDDCVRACESTHGGRPRFVREGDRYGNLMIAKSCYHCQDPVCLIGCPTGAIRRANVGDVVEIKENICIGCSTCSNNCPYDAIVMHDTGTLWPDNALPKSLRGAPRALASKCDLCYSETPGPACVRNCPQQCAFRVGSLEEFQHVQRKGGAG